MANKKLFGSTKYQVKSTDTRNKAGGRAYTQSAEKQLCQYVVTGTFNGVFYASAKEQLEDIKNTVEQCSSKIVAKAAVYGRVNGKMKDVPAYLLAVLAARGENNLLSDVFPQVVNNVKMLLNFVQIVRSGVTGRKSFGTFVKRLIQNWIVSQNADKLFLMSVGHSNPSFADVIKMVHPKPKDEVQNNMFKYILGFVYDFDMLPTRVREFEMFKVDKSGILPNVPFMVLSNLELTNDQWKQLGQNMPWNTLRMNLNQLERHDVFKDKNMVKFVANKLSNREEVLKNNVFPYQLLTTFQNTQAPNSIKAALSDAMEIATENVPEFDGDVVVCVDISGSMQSSITGYRAGSTSVTSCRDVAALIASCILRKNPDSIILGWDTSVRVMNLNPRDSILTNAKKISCPGGATDSSVALEYLNQKGWKGKTVIYVSDNQSWYGRGVSTFSYRRGRGTDMAKEWSKFKKRNKGAKLVCVDIQPYSTTQVPDDKDVLNIGGFSDTVFTVIDNFINTTTCNVLDVVNNVKLGETNEV